MCVFPDPSAAIDSEADQVLHSLSLPEGLGQTTAGHEEILLRRQNQPRQGQDGETVCTYIEDVIGVYT